MVGWLFPFAKSFQHLQNSFPQSTTLPYSSLWQGEVFLLSLSWGFRSSAEQGLSSAWHSASLRFGADSQHLKIAL